MSHPMFEWLRRYGSRRLCVAVLGAAAVALPAHAVDRLPAEVGTALDRAGVPRDAVVALVQAVGADKPQLTWQIDKPVNPASMTKLLTTYAGLDLLGRAWTWSTPVWLQGNVHDGLLDGNLVIKGTGDPSLVMERVWLLLRRVQQLGVREIHGDIVLDRSTFVLPDTSAYAFDGEGLRPYNVQPDALMLSFKAIVLTFTPDPARGLAAVSADPPLAGVRVDASVPLVDTPCEDWRDRLGADYTDPTQIKFSGTYSSACAERSWAVADADPKSFDARALLGMWQAMGGRVSGVVRDGTAPDTKATFLSTSPPLSQIVRDINKYSNNVMAQQLFLTLGLTQRDSGSPEASRQVLREWALQRFGSAADGLVIDNGSGLSRETRVSARLFARLLLQAWNEPLMPELLGSLSISGVDGTLQDSPIAPGRAHLKTGTLRDASGIAGYVMSEAGQRYVVVVIANDANASAARLAFEALFRWTAGLCATSPARRADDRRQARHGGARCHT